MSDHSSIEWCDATWSPTLGCLKVSDGCVNCYAIRTAYRQEHAFKRADYAGLTRRLPDGSLNWTGKVNVLPERLNLPLTWKKPRRVFVDSQSDLFHDDVSEEFIARVFAVMDAAPQHTYQVLTKRPARMAALLQSQAFEEAVCAALETLAGDRGWCYAGSEHWPLPNVWLGVSVEDQRAADERIPQLLQTPAAVCFLSCEPLLGPVDLAPWLRRGMACDGMCDEDAPGTCQRMEHRLRRPDWVIAGGESGPNARPMHPDWARSLRDQCQAAGVAFHFKQSSGPCPGQGRLLDGREWNEFPEPRVARAV